MKRISFILIIIILCFLMAGCDDQPPPTEIKKAPGHSLRVLTYNTYLLSPMMQCSGFWDLMCHTLNPLGEFVAQNAEAIGDKLNDGRFDIITFTEVWDEDDGKDILVSKLKGSHPYYVRYVDVVGGGVEEDSGLMLFSKFQFEPLPDSHFQSKDNETSYGDDYERVAFTKYEDCEGWDKDCLAGKGAMLVRLRHHSSEQIINTIVTHLQADYGGDDEKYPGTRSKQLNQVRAPNTSWNGAQHPTLIGKTLGPTGQHIFGWTNKELLLLTGDMNIQGQGAIGDALYNADNPNIGPGANGNEWWNRFGFPAANAANTHYALYDAWAETTSEADRGESHDSGERLDYIIPARRTKTTSTAMPPPDVCIQHIWNPPEFEGLSDHRPLAADINRHIPYCNPRIAYVPKAEEIGELGVTDGLEGKKLHSNLTYPGNMQWYRLNEAGTYIFGLDPNAKAQGLKFEVYQANNLSSPLKGAYELEEELMQACDYIVTSTGKTVGRCQEIMGQKMVLPNPPFYVRVFNEDRNWNGSYYLAIHKYTCKTKEEACELLPSAAFSFDFPPAGIPINAEYTAWFRLSISEQADSGKKQSLRFYVKNRTGQAWVDPKLSLLDMSLNQINQFDGEDIQGPFSQSIDGKSRVAYEGSTGNNTSVYLTVTRSDVNKPLKTYVGWQTNLTLIGGYNVGPIGSKLKCNDETNPESGEDDISLRVRIDNMNWHARGFAEFDCDDTAHQRPWNSKLGLIRFLDNVQLRPVEEDSTSGDDESEAGTVDTIDMETDMFLNNLLVHRWHNFVFSGGEYTFYYNVHKWRNN